MATSKRKRIQLRYDDRCVRCGQFLPSGTHADWSPDSRDVCCVTCPTKPPPRPSGAGRTQTTGNHSGAPEQPRHQPGHAPPLDGRWNELLDYYRRCLQRESVDDPPRFAEQLATARPRQTSRSERAPQRDDNAIAGEPRWLALTSGAEELVTGRGDELHEPGLAHLARSSGDAYLYGWPLVVLADRDRVFRVAPLLVTTLEASASAEGSFVAANSRPHLNPTLMSHALVPGESGMATAAVLRASSGWFGDVVATAALVEELCEQLGVEPHGRLDPDRLVRPARKEGVHNTAIGMLARQNPAASALLEELEQLADRSDWRETAAAWLADEEPKLAEPAVRAPSGGGPMRLNAGQEAALEEAARSPLTVVTGPPGTGKSELVAAIVADAWLSDESVLVASTNNQAVDVAANRAARALDEGALLRTGNKEVREQLASQLDRLARRGPGDHPSDELLRQRTIKLAEQRRDWHEQLGRRGRIERELLGLWADVEAHQQALWGAQPPELPPRVVARLARRSRRLQDGARLFAGPRRRRLRALARIPTDGGADFDVDELVGWAEKQQQATRFERELAALPEPDEHAEQRHAEQLDEAWRAASVKWAEAVVQRTLHRQRGRVQGLSRTRRGSRQARLEAMGDALAALKGWACTAHSVPANFPLRPALFDVAVVDEASQCQVAHILPIAYRAKRLVVVGDPNQLPPVSKLDPSQLADLAAAAATSSDDLRQRRLDWAEDSAYTAFGARAAGRSHLLDSHYRCHPQIAAYINRQFYEGQLRVLTDASALSAPLRGIHWVDCVGDTERPANRGGARNAAEARAVVDWLAAHADATARVGVVTPFAAQAELIARLVTDELGHDARSRMGLAIGTVHTYQGAERDLMLFSPVLSRGARAASARWVRTNRYLVNVAASRARAALVVVGDADALTRHGLDDLVELYEEAQRSGASAISEELLAEGPQVHSQAEGRLLRSLLARDLPVEPKLVVEGYELDFALRDGRARLDVECDGQHHEDSRGRQRRQDLARDTVIGRLGWEVLRAPAWRCLRQPEAVADDVARRWNALTQP